MRPLLSGAILCGGESSRMGRDKSQLLWRGRTLLECAQYQLSHLQQVAVIQKDIRPSCGPLGGIHTALMTCPTDAVFVTSCDTPLVDDSVVRQIWERLGDGDAAVAVDGVGANPLCAVYRKRCLQQVVAQMDSGDTSPQRLIKRLDTRFVPVPREKQININTPAEYRSFLLSQGDTPVCAFSGWADSGKTTVLERLIPALCRRGVRIAVIKHCHHAPEAGDGTDTARLSAAGAVCARPVREDTPGLSRITDVDLILAEGFKQGSWPKIWVHRTGSEPPPPKPYLAMLSDTETLVGVPRLDPRDTQGLADFLESIFLRQEALWNKAATGS